MKPVFAAFFKALASQLHPKMLALLLVPFVLAIVFWLVAAWWVWDPLNDWLRSTLFGAGRDGLISGWLKTVGLDGVGAWLSAALAVLLLAPLMFTLAIVVVSVVAMPVVNRHLGNTSYPTVLRRGRWSLGLGIWTAVSALAVFAVGYLLTIPLWLVPVLGLLVPWFWWSWLTARVMRFDSLVEHATDDERDALIARWRGSYWLLAFLVTGLNYIPPLFLVTPVLSALAFGHFSLAALREWRSQSPTPGDAILDGGKGLARLPE